MARLRKKAGVVAENLPAIRLVILDFTRVNFFDVTAMTKLRDFMSELKKYAGAACEVRFVGCNDVVRMRLMRGGWDTVDADNEEALKEGVKEGSTKCFKSVRSACESGGGSGSVSEIVEVNVKGSDEKV